MRPRAAETMARPLRDPEDDGRNAASRTAAPRPSAPPKLQRVADPAIRKSIQRWLKARGPRLQPGEIPKLERPKRLRIDYRRFTSPPRREFESFFASPVNVFARLMVWLAAALRFALGTLWDWVRRRDSQVRRAQRLRRILEGAGATFVKLGQQLSLRIDLVPYEYSQELEKMLDSCPPFPTPVAIKAIEEATGKPMSEVFANFDPEPIASASVACVFQGILKNGDKVAVKVRRPNIGEMFEADIRGLGWLLTVLETFVLPPTFSHHLLYELRSMLLEELDFVREARYTELFRRYARNQGMEFASSPRVYFELSNRTVMVTEFVTGIFLTELMAVVEAHDEQTLANLESQGIDPKVVARQIITINRYGGMESILFHADLHPGNVLVRPNNQLVLIDFGASGAFTSQERVIWRRILYAQSQEDIGMMVQAAMALMEPLPPIDVDVFAKKLEAVFWADLYAIKSRHSQWYERTTANLWIGFLKLAREYNVPSNINTLRMIRASMLADTIALRLDPSIDHYREYRKYLKGAGRRARKRLRKRLQDTFSDTEMVSWEQALQTFSGLMYRLQRNVDSTFVQYAKLQGKAAFGLTTVFSSILFGVVATGIILIGVGTYNHLVPGAAPKGPWDGFVEYVLPSGIYQGFLALVFLATVRRLLFRLGDKDR
jgi:ubiquinone biosynthesis protein